MISAFVKPVSTLLASLSVCCPDYLPCCQPLVHLSCFFVRALSFLWVPFYHFLCLKLSLRVGPSGWFTVDPPSVLRQGAMTPWRRTYYFCSYFSRYKFELRLPFSRQRCSLEISSALHRSFKARLTVERESRNSAEIVRIPGQHFPSLSAWSFRYI